MLRFISLRNDGENEIISAEMIEAKPAQPYCLVERYAGKNSCTPIQQVYFLSIDSRQQFETTSLCLRESKSF